jgi:hypothetical protein
MHGFEYLHLSLHNHETQHTELLNRVFEIWEKTFTGIAKTNEVALDPDEFFRSHHVGVLMFHDEIVGFNLFTMFDLSLLSTTRHRYFQASQPCAHHGVFHDHSQVAQTDEGNSLGRNPDGSWT